MVRNRALLLASVLFAVVDVLSLFAYDPPRGGELLSSLSSPVPVDGPESAALNPAANGTAQRPILDLSYGGITGLGSEKGYGTIVNAGFCLPEPYGVLNGGIQYADSSLSPLAIGSVFSATGSIAKQIYPGLVVGTGLGLMAGKGVSGSSDWGLGLDLGLAGLPRDTGPMKRLAWNAALTGIGKGFSPSGGTGFSGSAASAYPSPFTLSGGASFEAARMGSWGIRTGLAVVLPEFQNLIAVPSVSLAYGDSIRFSGSLSLNAREISAGKGNALPSFGLTANFDLDSSFPDAGSAAYGTRPGAVTPSLSARPLGSGVWAFMAGGSASLGKLDRKGPSIAAKWPEFTGDAPYLSLGTGRPNDSISVPVGITDDRFVMGYGFTVFDSTGKAVRRISGEAASPSSFLDRLLYVRKGAAVPESLTWDGRNDAGSFVPDGSYKVVIDAVDDNGNASKTDPFTVAVKSSPPTAEIIPPKGESDLIFSPDGDGNKDSLALGLKGSREDLWTGVFSDSGGKAVRSFEFVDSSPTGLSWDGKDDSGKVVPDGIYSFTLSAVDRAGNSVRKSLAEIVVNTQKPPVKLSIDSAWFSPTGDGARNSITFLLNVPVKAGIVDWKLAVSDAKGKLRWSAAGQSAQALVDHLAFAGRDSAGKLLEDGRYQAQLSVRYVNGNNSTAQSPAFNVKTNPPTATVRANFPAFSPNGDGNKDTVTFLETTSEEDQWVGMIVDESGQELIRTFKFQGKADPALVWDGTDDSGRLAPDGTYLYFLQATDRAGNFGASQPVSVLLDTEKKSVILSNDKAAFSPNGDGTRDTITLNAQIQKPEQVTKYELTIRDEQGNAVKTWTGSTEPPPEFVWDGLPSGGGKPVDGRYQGKLTVQYLAGQVETTQAPFFLLKTVFPAIEIAASNSVFCPGDQSLRKTLAITQSSVPGDDWTGIVVDSKGNPVRTFSWKNSALSFAWDGSDNAGNTVPDGTYSYAVSATDIAGNRTEKRIDGIVVDTRHMQVVLSASDAAFSPNGDGVKDTVAFNLQVQKPAEVADYTLNVSDEVGRTVKSWTGGPAVGTSFVWDGSGDGGEKLPDGRYSAKITVDYRSGRWETAGLPVPVILRSAFPKIAISANWLLFDPSSGSKRKDVTITQLSTPGNDWTGLILDKAGKTVKSYAWKDNAESFTWDALDDSGTAVSDGSYDYVVSSEDIAGNRTEKRIVGITVDSKPVKVAVSVSRPGFSPNGDGTAPDETFVTTVPLKDSVVGWKLDLVDASGTVQRSFSGTGPASILDRIVWAGKNSGGTIVQSTYTAHLAVDYEKGFTAEAVSSPFVLQTDSPGVEVSLSPQPFSPDGDGLDDVLSIGIAVESRIPIGPWSLQIRENQVVESLSPEFTPPDRLFIRFSGTGIPPAALEWNGRSDKNELVESATEYPYILTVSDVYGNVTVKKGLIAIDILVMRDGNRLKIQVPSIVFRANAADFDGLPQETLDNNERVIRRVAQILNKFTGYQVRVEGHGNNMSVLGGNKNLINAEEKNELLPLSSKRAQVIQQKLVDFGVDSSRLSVLGLGSSDPVVPVQDSVNRWKNRRVEFILIK